MNVTATAAKEPAANRDATANVSVNARASRPRFDVLAVLMLGGFINFLTIFELTPLLPGIAREFAVSAALGGQLATVTALAAFAGSLLATPFMDRVGRRAWLWAEAGLLMAGWLASVAAPGFGWLMAGRALSGLGLAVLMANVYAVTREVFEEPWRTRALALFMGAAVLAFVAGLPLVTTVNAEAGWRTALAVTGAPLALFLAGITWIPPARPAAAAAAGSGVFSAFRAVGRQREVLLLYGVIAAINGTYDGWLTYFGAWLDGEFAVSAATLSLLFMASGVVELGSDSALPAMIRRAGAPRVVAAGALVCAAALVLAGTAFASVRAAFVMAAMMNIGTSAVIIGVNARLLSTPTAAPGAVMSLAAAANGLGNWIGPLLTGSLLAATGEYPAAYRLLGLAPLICIVCVALARPDRSRAARPARPLRQPAPRTSAPRG